MLTVRRSIFVVVVAFGAAACAPAVSQPTSQAGGATAGGDVINRIFAACFREELKRDPSTTGDAIIEAQVAPPDGRITSAKVVVAHGVSDELTACMVEHVLTVGTSMPSRTSYVERIHLRVRRRSEESAGDANAAVREFQAMRVDFRACYDEALKTNSLLEASGALGIVVGPEGDVADVIPIDMKGFTPELLDCILTRARTGTFSPGSRARIPLKFEP